LFFQNGKKMKINREQIFNVKQKITHKQYTMRSADLKRRNAPFFSIILFVFFLNCNNPNEPSETEKRNAVLEYARTYSSTLSQRNWDDKYWDIIGIFDDVKSCNDAADLNRNAEERYDLQEDYWFWPDDTYRKEYQNKRTRLR
jgi:hypothetical protein